MSKVYIVEDSYQFDGGSMILGIYDNSKQALTHQQKIRREYSGKYKTLPVRIANVILESVGIREITINEEIKFE